MFRIGKSKTRSASRKPRASAAKRATQAARGAGVPASERVGGSGGTAPDLSRRERAQRVSHASGPGRRGPPQQRREGRPRGYAPRIRKDPERGRNAKHPAKVL